MSEDRNEGECYGPFHAGLICRDCAERWTESEVKILADAKERLETGSRWLKAEIAGRKKAEAEVERLEAEIREHRCVNDKGEYA